MTKKCSCYNNTFIKVSNQIKENKKYNVNNQNHNKTNKRKKHLNRMDKLFIEKTNNEHIKPVTIATMCGINLSTIYKKLKNGEVTRRFHYKVHVMVRDFVVYNFSDLERMQYHREQHPAIPT